MKISLRPASHEDMRQVFEWRNDPFILEQSSSRRPVEWAEHEAWFSAALKDSTKIIYFVVEDNNQIGLVRFDRTSMESCVISAYLMEAHVGKGRGAAAIRQGCALACESWEIHHVIAYVRTENAAGTKAFLKAGFSPRDVAGCPEGHAAFVLNCSSAKDGYAAA